MRVRHDAPPVGQSRITPAHGEISTTHQLDCCILQITPRTRGRDFNLKLGGVPIPGSPPRAGTKLGTQSLQIPDERITPRAGKKLGVEDCHERCPRITPAGGDETCRSPTPLPPTWDHPRAQGRNFPSTLSALASIGSPPRAGTKQIDPPYLIEAPRITPARGDET